MLNTYWMGEDIGSCQCQVNWLPLQRSREQPNLEVILILSSNNLQLCVFQLTMLFVISKNVVFLLDRPLMPGDMQILGRRTYSKLWYRVKEIYHGQLKYDQSIK